MGPLSFPVYTRHPSLASYDLNAARFGVFLPSNRERCPSHNVCGRDSRNRVTVTATSATLTSRSPLMAQAGASRVQARCTFEESATVGVTGLHCRSPDGVVLFDNMTFCVRPGERLLVMGPSGVGKSSLLRIIAGLWPADDGIVSRCGMAPSCPVVSHPSMRRPLPPVALVMQDVVCVYCHGS